MTGFYSLIKRNTKLFFKDKGMFFTSLITPLILLVLYATFLFNVYRDSFMSAVPEGFYVDEKLVNGIVGGQLISSLLAVSCVTVSFCANMLMVQDKVTGVIHDITITPVKRSTMALGYYVATLISTLMIGYIALAGGLVYLAVIGWYLSAADVALAILDVFLLVMFGTALSSIINCSLSSQGQISAVGTVVSSCYGFVCGAYMPISQFGDTLQKILMFLPGTYGTSLVRNHMMQGTFKEMLAQNYPAEVVEAIKDSVDCNLYFFDNKVSDGAMYAVLGGSVVLFVTAYVLINMLSKKKAK